MKNGILRHSKNLRMDNKKVKIIGKFTGFCCDRLGLVNPVIVYLCADRAKISTTAAYSPSEKTCFVYAKNRAIVDICRSIAHELTHMMQDENGLLGMPIKDIGGFHEDQANAFAGQLIKLFAKKVKNGKEIYE